MQSDAGSLHIATEYLMLHCTLSASSNNHDGIISKFI